MKRRLHENAWILLGLCLAVVPLRLFAVVNCAPDDITLTTQAEVDNFQANHGPGCDRIVTNLTVTGASIDDLTPLAGLTTVGWNSKFVIDGTSVTSLTGLEALTSVFRIEINNNAALTSIAALSSLSTVDGPLFIQNNPLITNLDGLENVVNISFGALWIEGNANLSDLGGVSNITSIGASLVVNNNDSLANLDDLAGLTHVPANINVSFNDGLTDLSGLSGMVDFDSTLYIRFNSQLVNLGSLPNLTDLGGLVLYSNNALTNVDGLSNLKTLGSDTSLAIQFNNALTNLDGLAGLVSVERDVTVADNTQLDDCSALLTLLDSVDDGQPGPGPGPAGIPDVGDEVTIEDNKAGCNSVVEITGESTPTDFELIPPFGGLGTHIGLRAIRGPDKSCGWPPGDTVEIRWDQPEVPLAEFTVDADGCFEGLLFLNDGEQLAGSLPGEHLVGAFADTGPKASNPFEQVVPQLILQPPMGPPELEINAIGCGWDGGANVDLTWIDDGSQLAFLVADGGGCIDDPVKLPREKNGIYAIAAASNTGQESGAAFQMIGASVFLTPAEGPPDSRVPLAGCNWFADEAIDFAFQNDQVVFDTGGSNMAGCIHSGGPTEPTLNIPPGATLGARIIQATGQISNQRVNVPFNVVERSLVFDPPNALIGDSVSVSGCGWVGNSQVTIEWGNLDHNNQPIRWHAPVDPDTGCFGLADDVLILVPADSITGELEQTATGDVNGQTTGLFTVDYDGYFELPNPNGYAGYDVTLQFHDVIVNEILTIQAGGNPATQISLHAPSSDFSFDYTLPIWSGLGAKTLSVRGTKGFRDGKDVNILDNSEVSVSKPDDLRLDRAVVVTGRNWSAFESISLDLMQGEVLVWPGPDLDIPGDATEFSQVMTPPSSLTPGPYTLRATGGFGRQAEIAVTVTDGAPSAFSLAAEYADTPPGLDGVLWSGEWDYDQRYTFEGGFITVMSDDTRLYILLDVLDDSGNDAPGQDNFWLSFDLVDNQQIDPGFDLNFRLAGNGDLIVEEYTGPDSFAPRNSVNLRSAYSAGFGCFAADDSARVEFNGLTPTFICENHRAFEIGIDLQSIQAEPGDIVRMGFRSHSPSPPFTEDTPPDFHSAFDNLGAITLAPSGIGGGAPNGMVTGIGSNGFEIELTQAIQDADNSLKLVARKDTAVRVYPDVADLSTVRTFLYGRRNGLDLPGSPLVNVAEIPPGIDRSFLFDTANFRLPASWVTAGATELTALVENLNGQNTELLVQSFTFYEQRIPNYWLILVNTGPVDDPVLLSEANIANHQSLLEVVYPLPEINWVRRPWQELGPMMPPDRDGILARLSDYYDDTAMAHATALEASGQEPFTMPEQIYGLRPGGGGRALTMRGGGRGLVATGGGSSTTIMAHEINHNLDPVVPGSWGKHVTDPKHETEPTKPDNDDWGCGATQPNGIWPRTNDEISEVGFDTRLPWLPAGTGPRTTIPSNYPDYMSYCNSEDEANGIDGQVPDSWVSPHRWKFQFIHFNPPPPSLAAPATIPGEVYYVTGELHDDGSGSLHPVRIQPGVPTALIPAGDYSIEIQDAGGQVLSETPFLTSFVGSEGEELETVRFHYLLPLQLGGAKVVLKHLGATLDLIEASANPPSLQVTVPAGGEEWMDEESIQWAANDLDGDPMTFSILYSPDGGDSWFPVASGLEGNEYLLDVSRLPGGLDGRIRVIVSDGFHTVTADSSGAFTVPEPVPVAVIESPIDGAKYLAGGPVPLRGSAVLSEPNGDDPVYVWLLDNEVIEFGPEAELRLGNGSHLVGLTVFTEGDVSEITQVTINVGKNDPPYEPILPSPADGSGNVFADSTLNWIGGDVDGDSVTYDVYLEAGNPEPSTLVCDDSPISLCDPPGGMLPLTEYFWQVIARDPMGETTPSQIWQFETNEFDPEEIIYADSFE